MPGTIACDPPPQPSKRKKTKDKWASLQRGLKRGMQRRLPSKAPAVKAPLRIPGRRKRAACGRQSSPSDVKERLGDIPRTINTLDERLLLPTLSSDDDVDSRCDTASLCSCSDSDAGGGETSSPTQTLAAESCDAVRSAAAESYDDVRCAPRRPSLEGMPDYVAALSPEVRDRDPAATSEALRRLRALSEGSKDLRLAMVRGGAAQDDDSSHGPLVPSLLSLAGASGGENVDRWRLSALSILHALSVPSANKRPMASDSGCGAVRILADLLRDGDGDDDERRASSPEVRRRAVVTVVELTFGDEDRPLSLDPDDERARRMVGRVVRFLELWRTKGLPWDFRALYGVNVGLCAA
ncbi:hypothetical protein ACHAWF_014963 [Thalassiosira exigua]